MPQVNHMIDYSIPDEDAQLICVAFAKSIKILEDKQLASLDADEWKLLYDLKCSQKLIAKLGYLKAYVDSIGLKQIYDLLEAVRALMGEDNDYIMDAYLLCETECYYHAYEEICDSEGLPNEILTQLPTL